MNGESAELLAALPSPTPFGSYQRGPLWLLASVVTAAVASFFFRSAAQSASR